jgi:hypothetical protein
VIVSADLVYVDEAQDYFDQQHRVILSQARKYRVGMVLAHQYLGQLDQGLQEAFEANTSIKTRRRRLPA